ncbi:cytochrome c biogenesis protein ResB [Paenibacillus sp. GCM10023248]|uniref:cytochrome c biogenesis protein ResB n=1 Tax=Bacillales TaxID=1385 RepID=UPI0023783DE7|nr:MULTISPECIES: cytochrome c biogenesis protein ResB [Bacillales]MDD9267595.1 cytochrome c biogenesis protein ResB [Paenibacillus sp. MAHUQ-63]MDR6884407.1 cytochrome c biogenesis protein [Bacillus sp. 3255]
MFYNTKCDCGHQNPTGTTLCESCGNPLIDSEGRDILEMRYDGMARRSQKSNPSLLDKVWNFFSSVKIAVWIIFITLLASAVGTIYPQENTFLDMDPAQYYAQSYGKLGTIYYQLGFSHTFSSWWFITLLFMIGTSLVICSLDRVLPLYRALSKQQIRKHLNFLTRQKVTLAAELPPGTNETEWTNQFGAILRKKNYRVHTDGSALLAEKYRFSRWGPYINHIGLIIFLLGVLMRSIPGWHMDEYMGVLEGETKQIPHTSYFIKNEKFTLELYDEKELPESVKAKGQVVAKTYETKAVLYHCSANCDDPTKEPVLEEVHKADILVNHPLSYKGLQAYQFDYKYAPLLISVKPTLSNPATGEQYGSFELPMNNPKDVYKVGPYTLTLKGYFPEFGLEKGQPISKSNEPKAPAFIFSITGPGLAAAGEPYLYFPRQIDKEAFSQDTINGAVAQKLKLSVGSMEGVKLSEYTTYLNLRVDKAMPYIWVGSAIFMIGVIMGFYWQHRRIWIRIDGGKLTLGGHTNKNWFGLRNEVAAALKKNHIEVLPKSLDNGGNQG